MNSQDHNARIRNFLSQFIQVDNLGDREDIFGLAVVNSLFAMQLVMFVENEFTVTVENDDLDLQNFNSVEAISAFVSRKMAASKE